MDGLENYRQSVKTLLQYADSMNKKSESTIEVETVFDIECDRYLLLNVGWQKTTGSFLPANILI
jgi:XisI protein